MLKVCTVSPKDVLFFNIFKIIYSNETKSYEIQINLENQEEQNSLLIEIHKDGNRCNGCECGGLQIYCVGSNIGFKLQNFQFPRLQRFCQN